MNCIASGADVRRLLLPARVIASRSPDAVRAAKRLLNVSALVPLSEGLANEFRASATLMGKPNQIEAVVARLQKRAPRFEGR